jgi:RND family efflux transporter MFP subunit
MIRNRIFISLLLIGLFVSMFGCKGKTTGEDAAVKLKPVKGITLSEIQATQIDEYYETSGTVRAKNVSVIASRVMGTITAVHVKEGDRVNKGQQLLSIDDRDAAQRVKAAEKAAEAAKQNSYMTDITYQRYKKLYEGKALSLQEIDQIETQKKVADSEYERAKAMLAEAQIQHGFAKLTAPVSGTVTEKKIELGSTAVPGMPVLTIEDNSSYRIEAPVDERLFNKIKRGMSVNIAIESIGNNMKGVISEIVPAIDPASRSFVVKIDLNGTPVKSGMFGKIYIPEGKKEAILIPAKAIVKKGQLTGVYVADEKDVLSYRLIKEGKAYNGLLEVLSGLNKNEKIVVDGIENAVDGGIITQQ